MRVCYLNHVNNPAAFKAVLSRIVLSVGGVCVGFLVVELFFMVVVKTRVVPIPPEFRTVTFIDNSKSYFLFDRELGWRLRPNYDAPDARINALGFRSSADRSFEELNRDHPVLLLGDSMVFGERVDQHKIFSEVLGRDVKGHCFINTGVQGYSPWQEYLVLDKILRQLHPEVIVIFFFQPNDLLFSTRTDHFHPGVRIQNGELFPSPAHRSFQQPLYELTYTYRWLSKKFINGKDLHYLLNSADLWVRRESSYVWRVQQLIYEHIQKLAVANGFKVYVVDIPAQNELSGRFHTYKPHQLLARLCQQNGFGYFDLLKFYPSNYAPLFLPNDEHWSSEGHAWIARFLEDHLPELSSDSGVSQ